MDIPCDIRNAFFLPSFLDMLATTGITKKVVMSAPMHPNRVGQMPEAPALPPNK